MPGRPLAIGIRAAAALLFVLCCAPAALGACGDHLAGHGQGVRAAGREMPLDPPAAPCVRCGEGAAGFPLLPPPAAATAPTAGELHAETRPDAPAAGLAMAAAPAFREESRFASPFQLERPPRQRPAPR